MGERLRLILRKAHWSLALKGLAFGLGWLWLPGWLFALLALFLYFKPLFQPGKLLRSFFVLLGLSLGFSALAPALLPLFSGIGELLAAFLAALFFLLMGIKDLAFVHRSGRYLLLYAGLFLGVFMLSFWYAAPRDALRLLLVAALFLAASTLLFREFLGVMRDNLFLGVPGTEEAASVWDEWKRRRVLVWALAFLVFQLFWAVNLLPIGFLMQAALLLLLVVLGSDALRAHMQGALTPFYVLRATTVLIFAALGIFAASNWEL
ncbi:MAG: hypothetical protein UZ00_C0001G0002 [Parcubacteria group bacterium GW2011_GWA1_60_11]|nr:MAG: hypothetical protein UZ00_C0001G0002 [Parcubacteria group bacterium GW2011_GWA1_60_11]